MPESVVNSVGGMICTFGSYSLGVLGKGLLKSVFLSYQSQSCPAQGMISLLKGKKRIYMQFLPFLNI